jgi:hypothetical protein
MKRLYGPVRRVRKLPAQLSAARQAANRIHRDPLEPRPVADLPPTRTVIESKAHSNVRYRVFLCRWRQSDPFGGIAYVYPFYAGTNDWHRAKSLADATPDRARIYGINDSQLYDNSKEIQEVGIQ